jgi:hypothetical protein
LPAINLNNGGTLEPGTIGVPGTFMTITGNLAFQSGAIYLVNISPTTASRANVGGAVTLNGAVQGLLLPGSCSGETTYDILDPPSISGKFTGFTAINELGFGGTLTYTPTDVLLNLTANLSGGFQSEPAKRRRQHQQFLQQRRHAAGRLLSDLRADGQQSGRHVVAIGRGGRDRRRQGGVPADDGVPHADA